MAQPWISKGQTRRNAVVLSVLHDELAALEEITVNDSTDDRMKEGAPDTFFTIQTYLNRRIAALG